MRAHARTSTTTSGTQIHGVRYPACPASACSTDVSGAPCAPTPRESWNRNDAQSCRAFQITTGVKYAKAMSAAAYGAGRRSQARASGVVARKSTRPAPKRNA